MELLERESTLADLAGWFTRAANGDGRMVLLAGEAGVGKTTLATAFTEGNGSDARTWWGGCDPMRIPTPLGPLRDMARSADELSAVLTADASQYACFAAFFDAMSESREPVVVVIEDVHWADQATLDLVVYLARRVGATRGLVLVTYRDDDLDLDHPFQTVLGDITRLPTVERLRLAPLSEQATAAMVAANSEFDPAWAYRVTGGNPFFIGELLATAGVDQSPVPTTVRDAVLTRVATLSLPARRALDAVSIVPDGAELPVVAAVTGQPNLDEIAECESVGLVTVHDGVVTFRHELARQAVEQSISAARAPTLHRGVLSCLVDEPSTDLARLAYHADLAGDREAVLVHAPAAAAHAASLGAHREAVELYRSAVRHAGVLPPDQRADLLERYAEECSATGRLTDGIAALNEAAGLRKELGDVAGQAKAIARCAGLRYATGEAKESHEAATNALAMVHDHDPAPEVAAVAAYCAYLDMVHDNHEHALATGSTAIELAERFSDHALLAIALVAVGRVQWLTDPDQGEATLLRAVDAAHASGRPASVTLASGALGLAALDARRFAQADRWLAETVDWCVRHDLDAPRDFYRSGQASSLLLQGRWPEASALLDRLRADDTYPAARTIARRLQAILAVRRGDPDQSGPLTEAWAAATRAGDLVRIWPVAAARAEAAWNSGRSDEIPALVTDTYRLAIEKDNPWAIGELALWLWKAGDLSQPPAGAAEPYALHIRGDWAAAADRWDALGCPYEAAMARAGSADPEAMRSALETFYRLGARPAANRLVHRLRKLGVTGLPRRPHRSTETNPAGLTDRELEVAALLADGLSNPDIASRLHISPRTAGHHVAAIFAKLDVSTRQDAAAACRSSGIAPVAVGS